ncbi:MAG: efflux RND transporter periplasmic adaptor subunit [Planctomycetales bacterium]|nr:efflux RND transporter periplasmic adaptor subunit [Planctomycetales bacterium]
MSRAPLARLAGLLALAACGGASGNSQPGRPAGPKKPPRVAVVEVAPRAVEYAVEATGTLEAAEEIEVAAGVNGLVESARFREGDAVTPETVLVEVDVERYRLAEAKARAESQRARAQAKLAETVYQNRLKLHEEGRRQQKDWVTEEQMAQWRADLDRARAEQEKAEADLAIASRDHRQSRVRAPIAGLINRKAAAKGEYVRTDTVVATILDVSTLHLILTVPELEAARLAVGGEALFSLRSTPGEWFRARLFHLGQKADPATRTVECRAEVLDQDAPRDARLRAGTFALVKLVTGSRMGIVVPERAVLPTERGFEARVVVGTKVASRPVKIGLRTAAGVEILEGLAAGDRVVTDGASGVRDGQEVEVAEEPRG